MQGFRDGQFLLRLNFSNSKQQRRVPIVPCPLDSLGGISCLFVCLFVFCLCVCVFPGEFKPQSSRAGSKQGRDQPRGDGKRALLAFSFCSKAGRGLREGHFASQSWFVLRAAVCSRAQGCSTFHSQQQRDAIFGASQKSNV